MLWLGDLKAGNDSDGPSAASARLATSVTQKKRAREQLDSGSVSSDSSGGAKPCESLATTKKKRKYRKATHTIRKVRPPATQCHGAVHLHACAY